MFSPMQSVTSLPAHVYKTLAGEGGRGNSLLGFVLSLQLTITQDGRDNILRFQIWALLYQ